MKYQWIRLLAGASGLALTLGSAPAQAQDAGVSSPEAADGDIIVTARTFQERLQDVPTSVAVLSAQQLDREGLRSLMDVAERTAGFAFEEGSGAVTQPSIRGQTNLRPTSPVQNVATYLDGIYLQRGYLIDQAITELERVEIIKGPQSALYGRNAFAGVINLATRSPNLNEIHGSLAGRIGTDEFYEASGWLSVPVIPGKLAILGAVTHSQFDGTWRNNHPLANADGANSKGKLGGFNKESYQARVIFKPVDVVEVDALYLHTDRFQESPATYQAPTIGLASSFNGVNCSPRGGQNRLFCGEIPVLPILAPGETRAPGIIVDPRAVGRQGPTDIVSGKVTIDPDGPLKFTYQLGYVRGEQETFYNSSRDPLTPVILAPALGGTNVGVIFDATGTDSAFKSWSHDLRISYEADRLRAFVGVNYNDVEDLESSASLTGPVNSLEFPNIANELFPIGPGLPFPNALLQRRTYLQVDEQIWGFYGFAEFDFTDALSASLEGRYTTEDRTATDFLTRQPGQTTIQALTPPVQNASNDFFAPRFNLTYKVAPDSMVYASVAKGVKSGGFNGFVPFLPQRTYDPETNWTYELGTKNVFRDIGLTLNASVFYTAWKNVQTSAGRLNADGTPFVSTAIVSTVTGNVGDVNIYGVDVDGAWKFADGFAIDFGAAYNRARYAGGQASQRFGASGNCDGIVCPTTAALPIGGNQVERIPEFDGFVGLGYSGEFGERGTFYLRGDMTYQTKQYIDEANLSWVSDRMLVNAQAGFGVGPFNVGFWARNLLDKKYVSTAFFQIGTSGPQTVTYAPYLGQRRTLGAQVSYSF